ncbi:serine hydrolase domain-containing protein [Tenacibaculum sp. HL-MS23]|uniref:serine hydrolase domain-containing protein n=1 Tax=Tenacibaculum sp. HL-MS23 TaxID=3077734 RepID=UPI0028FC1E75|nr:serine hydrolase domain-containing protein [Tenacibaculum sp. HL-MS23]WNW02049.1 serine hydrolase domain-containing protein [Tenacibaculum sp. HL-MS23]
MKLSVKLLLFVVSFSFSISNAQLKKQITTATNITKKLILNQNIPGLSITIAKKGVNIWSQGFGYADLENKKKVSSNSTLFRVASISKTITSIGLAKLIDLNKIKLNESLYKYAPYFPRKKYDFTLRQIGGHMAGIRHYNGNEFLINKKMSITKGLDVFKNSALLFKPGTRFKYSTYGFNLLSVVIQESSNNDFFEFMYKEIFNPLKMNHTFAESANYKVNNLTNFYIKRRDKVIIGPKVNNLYKAAGGGFLSTSEDLVLLGSEFINPKIISKKSLLEITTSNKTNDGKKTNYGIGISISKTKNNSLKLSHSGGGIGASSYLLIYPEEEITIAILTNLTNVKMNTYIKNLETIFVDGN